MSLIEDIKKLRKATESRFNSFEAIDMQFVFDKIEALIQQHRVSAERLYKALRKHGNVSMAGIDIPKGAEHEICKDVASELVNDVLALIQQHRRDPENVTCPAVISAERLYIMFMNKLDEINPEHGERDDLYEVIKAIASGLVVPEITGEQYYKALIRHYPLFHIGGDKYAKRLQWNELSDTDQEMYNAMATELNKLRRDK